MQGQIEVRIEPSNESAWEVYFWQNGRRSQSLNLYGPVDEYFLEGNPVPESIFAWVKLTIERQEIGKNKIVWGVTYKTNVVDNDLRLALERVKKNIFLVRKNFSESTIKLSLIMIKSPDK